MFLTGLLVYLVILVMMGVFLSRRVPDFDAYFYGKRKMGGGLIFFTVTASWFGAASTIATVEAARDSGFRALWLLGIPTLTTLLVFILINKRVRETRFVSLPVLLKKYYGKGVAGFASLLIFVYMVLLAASQLVAWGKFVGPFLGGGYEVTVMVGALVVIAYSYLGGYLSVVLTDGLQFVLMTAALVYLTVFFANSPVPVRPGDTDLFSGSGESLLITVSFTLAWVISPIVWQRIASARSASASLRGLWFSALALGLFYYLVIRLGMNLRDISAGPGGGGVFAFFVEHWLPTGGGLLVFLGISAAIMSTGDTAVNIAALTFVKDVVRVEGNRRLVRYARLGTLLAGVLAAITALRFDSIIQVLGLASEIMAEGLFVPGMYLLFFKKKRKWAGLLSLLLGGGFALLVFLGAHGVPLGLPRWPYSLPWGLGLSLLGFALGHIPDLRKTSGKNRGD